jgi:hypothetical protein
MPHKNKHLSTAWRPVFSTLHSGSSMSAGITAQLTAWIVACIYLMKFAFSIVVRYPNDKHTSSKMRPISSLVTEQVGDSYRRYSMPVSPGLYAQNPEYFSFFQPRVHRNAQISDDASVQCQIDLVGKENMGKIIGNMNTHSGGWISVCHPYCLPERIALVSYVNEAAYVHDGR